MSTVYLDVDDEITSAAARIRTASDVDVAIVLPAGSRIATSRINFRLLAHEATIRSRRLAIVAPEGSTRALAASAGLPVFATITEYEDAQAGGGGPGGAGDEGAGDGDEVAGAKTRVIGSAGAAVLGAAAGASAAAGAAGAASGAGAASVGTAGAAQTGSAAASRGAARRGGHARPSTPGPSTSGVSRAPAPKGPPPPVRVRPAYVDPGPNRGPVGPSTGLAAGAAAGPRRRSRWPVVLAVLLVLGLAGGAAAAVGYVMLPTATVTLHLVAAPVGPVAFTGVADPDAVAVDPATATIPATRIDIPLSASGTFKATGTRVESSAASGAVRWTNCDPTRSYTIAKGTIVRTGAGVAFTTREAAFLPVAILDLPNKITCQNKSVDVRAQRDGPAGNVAAGTITVIPGALNDVVIKVTNPKATSGGARDEFPRITEKDVTKAVAALTKQLDAQLAEVAMAPPGIPTGTTPYPETARRGEAVPSEPAADLVDREVTTFDLTLTADGTVVAADPSPLEQIATDRLATEVPPGMAIRDGSATVAIGDGTADGEIVRFPVTAAAEAVRGVTEDEVGALVKGTSPDEAQAALAPYGIADVVLWPDWATTVTGIDARITIVIVGVPPVESTPGVTGAPPGPSGAVESAAPPVASPVSSPVPSPDPAGTTPAPGTSPASSGSGEPAVSPVSPSAAP